ncbi:hypothetical protein [Microbacterium sp. RURRCA19A]|uniref:hypothetical protein n=1 Tax=Microbacterium sp. RURRCA19A TaxID=1907391 RepID=UPI0009566FAD|nr:hypothetical protein [Microbacterium sp. RURRCA19A]SIS16966.1 hypothetical protein SAMN05880568_3266 [Microbacterium sp. RURRCA19A]
MPGTTKVDPSLPQRAGRAASSWRAKLPKLEGYRQRSRVPAAGKKRSRDYAITVFSAVQPEIDPQRLVRALFAAFADYEIATQGRKKKRHR